jgi:CRP-like cAMP-binding protein
MPWGVYLAEPLQPQAHAMDERARLLSMVSGLRTMPIEGLQALAQLFEHKALEHEILCREGEDSDSLWVLCSGTIEVIKQTPRGPFMVAQIGPTSLIGHGGVMTLSARTATLKTKGQVEVLEMSAKDARCMLETSPPAVASPFRRALIVAMSRQLATATATIGRLTASGTPSEDAEAQLLRAQLGG